MREFERDIYFLKKTFVLAKEAEGCTSPNPLVGAVIAKNSRVIAQGFHKKAGLAHAEIEAIRSAKISIAGSTLYVNLEPCYHFGRTPPCVDEIIRRGIKKVVIATTDPNPLVSGKSIKKLRAAGIEVKVGLLRKEAEKLNEVFFTNMRLQRPFVVAKLAQSLDGKIATAKGLSQWITNPKSRFFSKSLRDRYDSVLVGVNTVIKDNPRLDGSKKIPFKIVLDHSLDIPVKSLLVRKYADRLILFTSEQGKKYLKRIPKDIRIFMLKAQGDYFPLKRVLKILYDLGIMSVFVEGGSETMGRFFEAKLVDKIYFFIAPKIIGGRKSLSSVGAEGFASLDKCPIIEDIEVKRLDSDMLISGYPRYR